MKKRVFKIVLSLLLVMCMLMPLSSCNDDEIPNDDGSEDTVGSSSAIKNYTRVNTDGTKNSEGEYILFGTYPQTEVTDSTLKSTLNGLAGTLPSTSNSQSWTSYEYYISGSNETDYMWYIDVESGNEKYRGVYFTSYRPYDTNEESSSVKTNQDENGYYSTTVYWFKYEPIKWRILTEKSGNAFLLCETLIDSQEYYHSTSSRTINGQIVCANNYEHSNIRTWLNNNFYNTAFTTIEKSIIKTTEVDNSAASTGFSTNSYACANTNDKVFLRSYSEATFSDNSYYSSGSGSYSAVRQKQTTDYAQCQGALTTTGSYAGNGYWLLRSPSRYGAEYALYGLGSVAHYITDVDNTCVGICPALWITL